MLSAHLATLAGTELDLLVEQDLIGRSPTYAPVKLSSAQPAGSIVRARVTGVDHQFAYAEAA
jgi:threonylcarbamoyladenosine tRNA methylthiotransferase MtaB